MKKTTVFLTCILCSAFVFSNGINKSPAENLIPDDAQFTFSPNSWEKTSYDKALVDFEFNDSLFSLGFAYKFKTMRIGLKFNSDYSLLFNRSLYSESVTETLNHPDGSTIDKVTVTTKSHDFFGENLWQFDAVLNIGFGDHFGIFLHPSTYQRGVYETPSLFTTVFDKDGNQIDSDFVSAQSFIESKEDSLFALTYNFYINDVFIKTLGGLSVYKPFNVVTSDDKTENKIESYVRGRFDLGIEIPQEENNHEIDLSLIFGPESTTFHKYHNEIRYGNQNSSFIVNSDYVFTHMFDNSGVLSLSGGLNFYSTKEALVSEYYTNFGNDNYHKDAARPEATTSKDSNEITALFPEVMIALKYPLIQDKLFLSLGTAANLTGFYKNTNTVYTREIDGDIENKSTEKTIMQDKIPMSTEFYGGFIFDISELFTVKSTIDLGVKNVTDGKLDYSFTVQGTYKL